MSTAHLDSFATVIMLIQAKDRVKNDFPKGAVVTYYDIAHNVYGSYLGIAVYFFSVTGSLGFVLHESESVVPFMPRTLIRTNTHTFT